MSMTVYDPDETPAAGNVLIAFGAGFASIAAPKLSELTINATCSIEQFDTSTDVSYKSKQTLCMLDAEEQVDKRTRKIAPLTIKSDKSKETALRALLVEDAHISIFVRPQVASTTALAVADKGWAFNATVAKFDPLTVSVGNDFAWVIELSEVSRNLNATLTA